MFEDKLNWRLSEWNCKYSNDKSAIHMTQNEIQSGISWLRLNKYPKPVDCPGYECSKYRPVCDMGICRIAIGMCGDF